MTFCCPACEKPLLSRLSPLCSHCGARVPVELLFSPAEKARIEAGEARAREALAAMEAAREKRPARKPGFIPPSLFQ